MILTGVVEVNWQVEGGVVHSITHIPSMYDVFTYTFS